MSSENERRGQPAWMTWTGWILSVLLSLTMLMGVAMWFGNREEMIKGMQQYGYPESVAGPLTIVQVVCGLLFLIPQTSALGAILLTAYMGGATATHVRTSDPVLNVAIPVIYGAFVWLALLLRDPLVRRLLPLRRG